MIGWSHDWLLSSRCCLKREAKPRGGEKLAEAACIFTYSSSFRLPLPRFPRSSRQCLRLPPLLPPHRFACPPSLARARKRSTTSISMRNRDPPTHPAALALGALAVPEAPFLHPNDHLTQDPPSPALPLTPPLQRSPMPNRKQKSPPEPKSSLFRRTRNHTTIYPNWHQNLIAPAQSSLVETPSEASSATDGGWVWAARTKTRTTFSRR
jgi:hypothetical protein